MWLSDLLKCWNVTILVSTLQQVLTTQGYESLWKEREGAINAKKDKESAWAFGWGGALVNKHLKVGMNGGLPDVASSIFIFPDDELIIVGLSNKTVKRMMCRSLCSMK